MTFLYLLFFVKNFFQLFLGETGGEPADCTGLGFECFGGAECKGCKCAVVVAGDSACQALVVAHLDFCCGVVFHNGINLSRILEIVNNFFQLFLSARQAA